MSKRDGHLARSAARLAAVQALFQMELADQDAETVIPDFIETRLGKEIEGVHYPPADERIFTDIVSGSVEQQTGIDGALDRCLPEDWPLHRIDSIMRALLRAAAFEILFRHQVPVRVALNEYTDIAHAFLDEREAGMANGILNRLARQARPDDFSGPAASDGAL
ncbi:MAG TPA: transcription antitermination factor NusB [Alphaproteobacteria bacterium]|nr:transcription antitermination factor NusB [Alphaproteobacteria bacterium]HAJ47475.1 transcription antitermination factor NusB [Alphaproteobacteria bacterium]